MKAELCATAKALRQQGEAIKVIARELKVSPNSVLRWTADIVLTEEQQRKLSRRNVVRAREVHREKYDERVVADTIEGRRKAENPDGLFVAGCMLYWAEGSKQSPAVNLANSDPDMIDLFLLFLERHFGVARSEVRWLLNCYTDQHTFDEIRDFWVSRVGLKAENMYKPTLNNRPSTSTMKHAKSLYGTCSVRIGSASVFRQLNAGIEEVRSRLTR